MSRFYDQTFNLDPDRFVEAVVGEVGRITRDVELKVIEILKREGKKASGDYIQSVTSEVHREALRIIGETGPTVSYGPFVEDDTKPHWAPIDPFKKWAREKFGAVGKEKDAIAYAARAKVAREGTKGAHALRDALLFIQPVLARRLATGAVRGI